MGSLEAASRRRPRNWVALVLSLGLALSVIPLASKSMANPKKGQKQKQTISFIPPSSVALAIGSLQLEATASSGLPVSFSVRTKSNCSVSGSTLSLLAAGICTVRASQGGDSTWAAAPSVTREINITVERITFTSTRDGNPEIYIMNSDGSNVLRITNNTFQDSNPSWSPDRSKLLFASDRDGGSSGSGWELYSMNPDGSNVIRLTFFNQTGPTCCNTLIGRWSPDGTKIAITTERVVEQPNCIGCTNYEIFVINADGSNSLRLTENIYRDIANSWSPDGSRLLFSSDRSGKTQLYVMNSDGANVVRITDNSAQDAYAAWSPDGMLIAFASDREGAYDQYRIFIMNSDGTSPTRVTTSSAKEIAPSWSPDGNRLSFTSSNLGNDEILVVNRDGSGIVNLTNDASGDFAASWSYR